MRRAAIAPVPARHFVITVFAVTLLAGGTGLLGQTGTQPDKFQEVREALKRAALTYPQPLREVQWTNLIRLGGTDHAIIQVQGQNGRGNRIEMEVTAAGRIVEVEEHGIPIAEVPIVVVTALRTKMPQFEPTKIEAIYQAEQPLPVCFGFEGTDADGRRTEVYISADGKRFLN